VFSDDDLSGGMVTIVTGLIWLAKWLLIWIISFSIGALFADIPDIGDTLSISVAVLLFIAIGKNT